MTCKPPTLCSNASRGRCSNCERPANTGHFIVPPRCGRRPNPEDMAVLCRECARRNDAILPLEYYARRVGLTPKTETTP